MTKKRVAWNKDGKAPWAKNLPQQFKKGQTGLRTGIKMSEEAKKKSSESHKRNTGENSSNWKGGISTRYKIKNAPRPKPERCEACGSNGTICYDHDHVSNEFRGWICMQCNFALGLVHDDKKILLDLINYLTKHGK